MVHVHGKATVRVAALKHTNTVRDNCVKGLERLRLYCCAMRGNMQDYHVWLDNFFYHC